MRVVLKKRMAGPGGNFAPGETISVPDELAVELENDNAIEKLKAKELKQEIKQEVKEVKQEVKPAVKKQAIKKVTK